MEDGESISQRTWMKDLWTWTMVWGLTTEVGDRVGGGGRGEKSETTIIAQRVLLKRNKIYF